MTTTVVSASVTAALDALDITTSNNVLVLSNVNLISTGAVGIQYGAAVTGGVTTMDGFVYGDTSGIQMLAGGQNEKLNIYGNVQSGGNGIDAGAGGAHIFVADGASVTGATNGMNITGGTVSVENHGTIASDNFSAGYGIHVGGVVVSQILNYGYIGGVNSQSQNMLLVNFGVIEGVGTGPGEVSTVNVVRNYGTINDYVSLHNGDQLFNFGGDIDGNVTLNGNFVKNTGTIDGDVSDASSGSDLITNKGTITGDVSLSNGSNSFDSHNGHVLGTVTGGSNTDTILMGSDDDTVLGGVGADTLSGGGGDDNLNGGKNADVLTGGRGDDLLTGGLNGDIFKFAGKFGQDVITDFTAGAASGHDVISFAHNDFVDFADVQANATQVGADVLITLDGQNSLLLQAVTLASLVAADFTFP